MLLLLLVIKRKQSDSVIQERTSVLPVEFEGILVSDFNSFLKRALSPVLYTLSLLFFY